MKRNYRRLGKEELIMIERLLKVQPELSLRKIAKIVGVSHETVRRYKKMITCDKRRQKSSELSMAYTHKIDS